MRAFDSKISIVWIVYVELNGREILYKFYDLSTKKQQQNTSTGNISRNWNWYADHSTSPTYYRLWSLCSFCNAWLSLSDLSFIFRTDSFLFLSLCLSLYLPAYFSSSLPQHWHRWGGISYDLRFFGAVVVLYILRTWKKNKCDKNVTHMTLIHSIEATTWHVPIHEYRC